MKCVSPSTVDVAFVSLLVYLPLSRCCTGEGKVLFCSGIPAGKESQFDVVMRLQITEYRRNWLIFIPR